MATKYKAMAGWQFSAEGQILAGRWGGFSRSTGRWCQRFAQALPCPPHPVPVRSWAAGVGQLWVSPSAAATRPTVSQPRGLCIFPLCPHRQHCQPQLWPFPLPPRTQHRVLLTAARGTWQSLTPPCPLSQPGSPWGCPSSGSSPDRSQLCYFPSRQVLIIIHLHKIGNGCNSHKAVCLTRAAEGLP